MPAVTRRSFLSRAAGALAAPYVLTSQALGAGGKAPASDRIVAGAIGIGGRGGALLTMNNDPRCTIAAVCDVHGANLAKGKRAMGSKCAAYVDFRRIIERRDLDAVTIGTPDHWHAPMTILACESGKDVYCEKPLCRALGEGRRMVEAARRHGRVVQMGTQYRSQAHMRQACEWVRNGRLGKVHMVRLWHRPNPREPITPGGTVPAGLDWDLWLGPAPWAAYHPKRCLFNFRFWVDYGGGFIADNGAHMFGVVCWAMGLDRTGPTTVEATGTEASDNLYDVPVEMTVRYEFADPPFVLTWTQKPGVGLNMQFVGTEGTLNGFFRPSLTQGSPDLSPTRPNEVRLYESDDHIGNWFNCVRTRRRPACDVATGHRITSLPHLGNIAYRVGRKIRWDPVAERILGDGEASRLLDEPYREPWRM